MNKWNELKWITKMEWNRLQFCESILNWIKYVAANEPNKWIEISITCSNFSSSNNNNNICSSNRFPFSLFAIFTFFLFFQSVFPFHSSPFTYNSISSSHLTVIVVVVVDPFFFFPLQSNTTEIDYMYT